MSNDLNNASAHASLFISALPKTRWVLDGHAEYYIETSNSTNPAGAKEAGVQPIACPGSTPVSDFRSTPLVLLKLFKLPKLLQAATSRSSC